MIAASTVLLPATAYAVAKDEMWRPFDELKAWLLANNAAVMGVLVIGTVLVGKGLGGACCDGAVPARRSGLLPDPCSSGSSSGRDEAEAASTG